MKIVHNKRANLGLIFEYLLQEIVESIVHKNYNKKNKLINIVTKYFYKNPLLKEEFAVFTALLNGDYPDKDEARKYLVECLKIVESLKDNIQERKEVKQKLLEEIYSVVDKNTFFEHNIKNYTVYSTINLILDYYSKNKKINDIHSLIELERSLLEHIRDNKVKHYNKETAQKMIVEATQDSLDENAQLIAMIKYRSNFYNKLNEQQKEILDFYISTPDESIIENKLNKHFRANHGEMKKKFLTETVTYTKDKLKDALTLFEQTYKSSKTIEEKLKIVLDSFFVLGE